MHHRHLMPLILLGLMSCTSLPGRAPVASSAPPPISTPISRIAATISGQPLTFPPPGAEMVATRVLFPANARTNVHRHPYARLAYVEEGRLSVTNLDSGTTIVVAAGETFAEAVGQWHQGIALDGKPARLLVIDLVPPGATNVEARP